MYEVPNKTVVYLQLLSAMLFFGLSFVFTSLALVDLRPVSLIFVRLLLSLAVLLSLGRVHIVRRIVGPLQRPDREHIGLFVLIAFFQPFLYFLSENSGLLYTSPAVASIIIATIPVVTPLMVFLFLRERVRAATVIGAFLSFGGVALLVGGDLSVGDAPLFGAGLIFCAVLAAVGYSISLRRLPDRYSSMTIVTIQNAIGLILFFPFVLLFDLPEYPAASAVSSDTIWAVVYLGIFPSTVSFIFLSRGIRILGAVNANITANTVPVFATIFSVVVLGETIAGTTIAGMLVVIAGVLLSQISRMRTAAKSKRTRDGEDEHDVAGPVA